MFTSMNLSLSDQANKSPVMLSRLTRELRPQLFKSKNPSREHDSWTIGWNMCTAFTMCQVMTAACTPAEAPA